MNEIPILDYYTLAAQTALVFLVFALVAWWLCVFADDFDAWTTRLYRVVFPTPVQWDTEQCGWCEQYKHLGQDSVCIATTYARGHTIAVSHVRVCGACAAVLTQTERVA